MVPNHQSVSRTDVFSGDDEYDFVFGGYRDSISDIEFGDLNHPSVTRTGVLLSDCEVEEKKKDSSWRSLSDLNLQTQLIELRLLRDRMEKLSDRLRSLMECLSGECRTKSECDGEINNLMGRISDVESGKDLLGEEVCDIYKEFKKLEKDGSSLRYFPERMKILGDCIISMFLCKNNLSKFKKQMTVIQIPGNFDTGDSKCQCISANHMQQQLQADHLNTAASIPMANKGKMNYATNGTPPEHSKDREVEDMATFAYLILMFSYMFMYWMLSSSLRRMSDDHSNLMIGVHVWTLLLLLVVFINSYFQRSARAMKTLHGFTSGILFLSTLVLFILIQVLL